MAKEYKIGGITVEFPYKAYGPQLAYMSKVVATLEQSRQRAEGRCNALLESPTGSGKSLALLCSALAWQQHYKVSLSKAESNSEKLHPPESKNVFAEGGGFVAEDSPAGNLFSGLEPESGNITGPQQNGPGIPTRKIERACKPPRIYYTTRTHAQITQVIREFRKTSYRVPMAILGAKKHYCTNKTVQKKKNVDEDCLALLRGSEALGQPQMGCRYYKNASGVKSHPTIQRGGEKEIHDIEDLVAIGHRVKGCPYFAAREMATEAEIVFCPYSYIVDPIIREAVEADIRGSIIIFDEAHNIEDVAREAGSIDLETKALTDLQIELEQLLVFEPNADFYQPLLEMVQDLLGWTEYQSNHLTRLEFEHHSSCWTGAKAVEELRAAGIPLQSFEILLSFSRKAVTAASDDKVNHLTGHSVNTLERLFRVLQFMLRDNARRAVDYQLVVQKFVRREKAAAGSTWVLSVSLWSLNPAVVFEEIGSACRSVIVTSGTLAPFESFASELGVPFEVRIEARHVVDMKTQVWATALSVGPGEVVLNASYKNAENFLFQDAVGAALLEIVKVTPDGVLVFLPSYKLLNKLCDRWQSTGQWLVLASRKRLFVEPRVNDERFESILQGYYAAINGDQQPIMPTSRKMSRMLKVMGPPSDSNNATKGAVFLAVCRGKVSEGINFSDKNARAVVVVGIPFPNVKDIQVSLKKQYNSMQRTSKNLLSGDQWYCQQAFRALNQAVGRCIRHRYDYGGIILLDERFRATRNLEYMSKWLRNSIQQSDNFQASMVSLKNFFNQSKELDGLQFSRTKESEVAESIPEATISVQKKDSSPATLPPITPLKSESGSLRLSNCLDTTKTEDQINDCGNDVAISQYACLRSELLPQFEATETRPTPSFCNKQETSFSSGPESGPEFLTQPFFQGRSSVENSTFLIFPDNHIDTRDSPDLAAEVPLGDNCCEGDFESCESDFELDRMTISIIDDEGDVFSSKEVQNHDRNNVSPNPACNSGQHRDAASEKGLLMSEPAVSNPGLGYVVSRTAEPNKHQITNTHGQPCSNTGPVTRENELNPYPSIHCRRCGLGLGPISNGSTEKITKSYLNFLLNPSGQQSHLWGGRNQMYSTDIACIGPGLTCLDEPGKVANVDQGAGLWVERDGCVYRKLACSSCRDSCIGAHILAANRKNLDWIDKVVLFVDFVSVEQKSMTTTCCGNNIVGESIAEALNLKPIESPSKRNSARPLSTGKLKLRRR